MLKNTKTEFLIAKWSMMQRIKDILLLNNIYIFGGFIRDSIIRNHNEQEYYKSCKTLNVSKEVIDKKYYDMDYLPEYADRMLVPKDIDCFIQKIEPYDLMREFRKNNLNCEVLFDRQIATSFPYQNMQCEDEDFKKIMHSRLNIENIEIDLMYFDIEKYKPYCLRYYMDDSDDTNNDNTKTYVDMYLIFTSNIDYECNNLILTPENEYKLSCELYKKMYEYQLEIPEHSLVSKNTTKSNNYILKVIENIKHKKTSAVTQNKIPNYRLAKFLDNGWKITTPYYTLFKNNKLENKYCSLCKCPFKKTGYIFNLKCIFDIPILDLITSYIKYTNKYNDYIIKDSKTNNINHYLCYYRENYKFNYNNKNDNILKPDNVEYLLYEAPLFVKK